MTKPVTISASVDEDIRKRARVKAAQEDKSLREWAGEVITKAVTARNGTRRTRK